MFELIVAIVGALIGAFARAHLVAENLALRQQLAVLRRKTARPRLIPIDRAFWILLSRVWSKWSDALAIVKPETLIAWHRRGFARFWAWKSRRRGRQPTTPEIVALIVRIVHENPRWSRRRIANELAMLGLPRGQEHGCQVHAETRRPTTPAAVADVGHVHAQPSRRHHRGRLLHVPTVRFEILNVFVVLSLERRCVLHVNVTAHPYAEWTAQQIVEAIGLDDTFKMLIRDAMGSTAPRSIAA